MLRASPVFFIFCVTVWRHPFMRFLAFLLGGIGLFLLSGYKYLRRMGLDPKGTTIPQSMPLAFVRRHMFRIADAEREELTAFSECDQVVKHVPRGDALTNNKENRAYSSP